jgi:hypothetical protein
MRMPVARPRASRFGRRIVDGDVRHQRLIHYDAIHHCMAKFDGFIERALVSGGSATTIVRSNWRHRVVFVLRFRAAFLLHRSCGQTARAGR